MISAKAFQLSQSLRDFPKWRQRFLAHEILMNISDDETERQFHLTEMEKAKSEMKQRAILKTIRFTRDDLSDNLLGHLLNMKIYWEKKLNGERYDPNICKLAQLTGFLHIQEGLLQDYLNRDKLANENGLYYISIGELSSMVSLSAFSYLKEEYKLIEDKFDELVTMLQPFNNVVSETDGNSISFIAPLHQQSIFRDLENALHERIQLIPIHPAVRLISQLSEPV